MSDDVKRTVVQIDYDQGSGKRLESGIERVQKRFAELKAETIVAKVVVGELSRAYAIQDRVGNKLAQDTRGLSRVTSGYGKEAKEVGKHVDRLADEIDDADKAVKKLDRTMATADGATHYRAQIDDAARRSELLGDTDSRLAAVSGFARTAGAGGAADALAGTSDFLGAAEGLQRMRAELPALAAQLGTSTAALGALGVGLVALNIAAGKLKESIADTGEATRSFVDANQKYAEIIATGTTEDVKAAIQAEEDRQEALRIEREMLDEFVAQVDDIDGITGAFLDLSDALGANYGGVEDVKNRLKDLNSELSASESVQVRLGQALDKGLTVANDAEAAEAALADERERAYQATLDLIDKQVADVAALRRGVETATVEQVDAQIAELQRRIQSEYDRQTLLSQRFDEGAITFDEYQAKLKLSHAAVEDLRFQIADWNTYVRDAAEARELETGALRLHKRALDDYAAAQNAYAKSTQEYADTLGKRELKLAQDAEKFALERTRDLADHYAEMAELDRDYYADRGDILRDMRGDLAGIDQEQVDELADLNDDLQDLARDHADKMRHIERDANRDIQSAAARFDAFGVFQAEQARRDAIEDEQKQYDDEKAEREEQFADRLELLDRERDETRQAADQALRDLAQKHQQERVETERAFAEEIRREDENRRLKQQHQQQQWDLEDQQRQAHHGVVTASTATYHANLEGMTDTHLANMEAKFDASFGRMAVPASMSSPLANYNPGPKMAAYGGGGYPAVYQDVIVGDKGPEVARFLQPVRIYPHGVTPPGGFGGGGSGSIQMGDININVPPGSGADPQAIGAVVRDVMVDILDGVGRN